MAAAGVPTAGHEVLTSAEHALERLAAADYPLVLKADGLAAGKGVIICGTEDEARDAVDVFFTQRRFGQTEVVLEEFLDGEELSLLALCDGENVVPLAPAQDYKRIFDGDEGPNTGGMGSYSPVPGVDPSRVEELTDAVHRPIVEVMASRGTPFKGVLYAGLMMTSAGPRVLEFNTRFGDPETQAVLPRLRSDLAELCLASREPGGLAGMGAEFTERLGGHARPCVGRLSGIVVEGRRDLWTRRSSGARRRRRDPRRHSARRRRQRCHGRRARDQRDRARARARPRPATAPTRPRH